MRRNKLFFFFIDGIGLGENNADRNPLIHLFHPFIRPHLYIRDHVPFAEKSVVLLPVDAGLGIRGIPQSATGQTTIMTGINAAEILGYHLLAFPNQKLLPLIREHSVFKTLTEKGAAVTSANLYSRSFFDERKKRRRNMFPVSTLSIEAAGIEFRYIDDYSRGEAVFADITNDMLIDRGYPVQQISPHEAGQRVLNIFNSHDLVFFEYFLTDTYGHSREREKIVHSVEVINQFLSSIWEGSDGEIDIMVISDHGNAEDMETGDHTHNKVPFLLLSPAAAELAPLWTKVKSLTDISSFVLDYFNGFPEHPYPRAADK